MSNDHAIVYWFPAKLAPPRGRPVSRQWSLPEALSRYRDVIVLSAGDESVRHLEISRPTDALWLIDGAFGMALRAPRAKLGRALLPVDRLGLRRAIRSTGHESWTMWLSTADLAFVPRGLPPDQLVYDCIDPPFDASAPHVHDGRERRVVGRAGITFATAEALEERVAPYTKNHTRLPNACSDLGALPPLRNGAAPRIGYLGTIDWRFTVQCVADAARALPGCSFVLGGRINSDKADEVNDSLRGLANVELLGAVSEEDGQSLIESFDVGLIPFTENSTGDAINPVKMYAYLERGVSVAATDIRECRGLEPHVRVGSGSRGFTNAIASSLAARSRETQEDGRRYALENTWDMRARTALAAMDAAGVRSR